MSLTLSVSLLPLFLSLLSAVAAAVFPGKVSLLLVVLSSVLLGLGLRNSVRFDREIRGRNWLQIGIVTALFILGFWVRLTGITFGLPSLYHPDEGIKGRLIKRAVETGDWNPKIFRHPSFLIHSGAFTLLVREKLLATPITQEEAVLSGRYVSAAFGALAIPLVAAIGFCVAGSITGVYAGLLVAFTPLSVSCSRYLKEDSSLVFFVLLTLFVTIVALKRGKPSYLLWAGFLAGITTSVKYSGALALGFPIFALIVFFLKNYRRTELSSFALREIPNLCSGKKLVMIAGSILPLFLVGFFLITPHAFYDTSLFLRDLTGELGKASRGHTVALPPFHFLGVFYLERSLIPTFGLAGIVLALIGIGVSLSRSSFFWLLLCGTLMIFYLPVEFSPAKPEPQPDRYVLPVVPIMALFIGFTVQSGIESFRRLRVTLTLLALLILTHSIRYTVMFTKEAATDTRAEALEWLDKTTEPSTRILIDWKYYSPYRTDSARFGELKRSSKPLKQFEVEAVKNSGYDYLVLSSFTYARFLSEGFDRHPTRQRIVRIFRELPMVQAFRKPNGPYGFHNPDIYIFQLPNASRMNPTMGLP